MTEPTRPAVSVAPYVTAHNRHPFGQGKWRFAFFRQGQMRHSEAQTFEGGWPDAKGRAQRYAAEQGYVHLTLLPYAG